MKWHGDSHRVIRLFSANSSSGATSTGKIWCTVTFAARPQTSQAGCFFKCAARTRRHAPARCRWSRMYRGRSQSGNQLTTNTYSFVNMAGLSCCRAHTAGHTDNCYIVYRNTLVAPAGFHETGAYTYASQHSRGVCKLLLVVRIDLRKRHAPRSVMG